MSVGLVKNIEIFFVTNPIMFHCVMVLGQDTDVWDSNSVSFRKPQPKSESISRSNKRI